MATQDPRSGRAVISDHEAEMAERRGRRLNLSCRLFFFGEDDFEGEATILDLSTGGCQATSLTEVQVGMTLRLSLFLQDQEWPVRIDEALVRWVGCGLRSRIYRNPIGPTRARPCLDYESQALTVH